MNWRVWLHSLASAAIGGASSSITAAVAVPSSFNLSHAGLVNLAKVAIVGAIVAVAATLKQSPLPASTVTEKTTQEKTIQITKEN